MKKLFAVAVAVIIVVLGIMFSYGSSISDTCMTIGGQKSCWKNYEITINSPLCSKSPCAASPGLQKYNTIVDAISSSCDTAKQNDFSDTNLNKEIEDALAQITSYSVNARTLCSDPGVILAKKFYD